MNRRGFTLIEVLVALTLAGLGVAIAAGMVASATDALDVMLRESKRVEAEAAGLLWLADASFAAEAIPRPDHAFRGRSDSLRYRSKLPVAIGWSEPTTVEAVFAAGRLTVVTSELTYVFADSMVASAFDYLADLGSASPWLPRWESATAAPIAIRWRRELADGRGDTTLFFVGRAQ